jgi:hypothetical protein
MDQTVMRFADAARTAAFGGAGEPTLAEHGMSVEVYDGSSFIAIGGGGSGDTADIVIGTQVFS